MSSILENLTRKPLRVYAFFNFFAKLGLRTSRQFFCKTCYGCIFLCLTLLVSCDSGENAYVAPPPPKVRVAFPVQKDVTQYFELTGNMAAINSVDISARVQGTLESIDYADGTEVTKGAPLFRIKDDAYLAQVDQARAMLSSAQASQVGANQEYNRQLDLAKQHITTQTAVDSAKAALDQENAAVLNAQASLDLAKINLGYTIITAPFDGSVTAHLADVGSLVGVGGPTKLATIVQTNPLFVNFNVSEAQVLQIKEQLAKQGRELQQSDLPNIAVEIGLQDAKDFPFKGHLDYVAPQLDAASGTLTLRGIIDNGSQALLPGLFVRIRVPVSRQDKALLVRSDAIGTDQQGTYVLVVGKDDVVEQKFVKIGQSEGRLRVVETGLEPDDAVITQGIQQAVPGNKVAPETITLDAASQEIQR